MTEPPALSLNLSRRLANGGLVTGARHRWTIFDAATLHNAPVVVDVGKRELVRGPGTAPIPAFRVETEFSGLHTTSWVTDTGEVVREESPLGLMTDPRIAGERARDGRAGPGADRPARGIGHRARRPGTDRRAARRPAAPDAARRRRPVGARSRRRQPDARGQHRRAARSAGSARDGRRPRCRAVPGAGAAHRKRRSGHPRRGRDRRARSRRRRATAPNGSRATSTVSWKKSRRSASRRRARSCAPRSATATSTRPSSSPWRARPGFPRASRSASCSCAARSTTTRGPRCTSTKAAAASGCRSIRRSTSFRPTPPTCASRAAASTGRPRFFRCSDGSR